MPERGVEIALLDFGGEGPPLLAHHANGFCAAMWAPVLEALRSRFRIFAMDARGHGDSSSPEGAAPFAWSEFVGDVGAVADRIADEQGEPVALGLGHSFGGTSTLGAAAARPGRFGRVLCVDPVIFPPTGVDAERAARGSRLVEGTLRRRREWPSREEALTHLRSRDLFAEFTGRALELYVDEGMRPTGDGGVSLKCAPEVEAAVFSGPGSFDVFSAVEDLATPSRLLWARGGNFPRALYEALVEKMKAGDVEDIEGGHLVPMEDPARVVAAIERFVDEPFA